MPVNITLGRHLWEAEVVLERRHFWMDASKLAARNPAVMLIPPETMKALVEADMEILVSVIGCFVDFTRPGCERIRFRVNRRKDGRFTFSDPRGRDAGTGGTTALWGTRPPIKASRPRSLTPNAFKAEAARLAGAQKAEQIILEIRNSFFSDDI